MKNKTLNRKEFFESFARFGIIGGFVLLGGFLLFKREVTLEKTCSESFACDSCKKYNSCNLSEKDILTLGE